jgi:putative Mn2+ efflux pump MntP
MFTLACMIAQAFPGAGFNEWTFFAFRLCFIIGVFTTLFVGAGTILGRIVERYGSRRDANLATAIFVGYAIGQWIPKFF